jgi:hypothetical protein
MSWVAFTRRPVSGRKDLDQLKPPDGLGSLSKREREQFDAAKKAAEQTIGSFENEVSISISGNLDPPEVRIYVTETAQEG